MKYLDMYTANGGTAFLGKVSDTCYKVGIETETLKVTSGYSTYEEAKEAFKYYKDAIDKLW